LVISKTVWDKRSSKSLGSNVRFCMVESVQCSHAGGSRDDFFTARRVCVAWQDVCPSVCHTPVLYLNNYTYPEVLSPLGSSTILVLPHQTRWQYSDVDSPNGVVEYPPISCFISQMMLDRAIVTMEDE